MALETIKAEPDPPFRTHEVIDDDGRRVLIVDANSAEARAMTTEEFWGRLLGTRITVGEVNRFLDAFAFSDQVSEEAELTDSKEIADLPLEIARYFGQPDAPDELVVAYPLFDTREENTPPKEMVAQCRANGSMVDSGAFGRNIVFPALFESRESGFRTLVSVGEADWGTALTRFDGVENAGFTVFRAIATKVPQHFLNEMGVFGPSSNLSDSQWELLK